MTAQKLEQYFSLHSQRLLKFCFGVAYHLGLPQETAEDAFQEAFVKFYRSFGDENNPLHPNSLPSWLMTVARNYLLNARKDVKKISCSLDAEERDIADRAANENPAYRLEITENVEKVKTWLAGLEKDRAQVVYLRIYQNLSTEETARQLQIPAGTVKSRLKRAVESLKTYLASTQSE